MLPLTFDPISLIHSGVNAAKVNFNVPGGDIGFDRGDATVPVVPNSTVRISFWMRNGAEIESQINRVSVAAFRQDGSFVGDTNYLSGLVVPDVWTKYSVDYLVPAEVTNVSLGFRAVANGSSIVLDDVSVINLATNTELVTNGGFEDWPGDINSNPPDWRFFAVGGAAGELMRLSTATTTVENWMLFE